jgi:hypothetical protein
MKAVVAAAICSIAATSAALSASVAVPDSSASLGGVAGTTSAVLLDAGLRPQSTGGGVFVLEAKNVHCDQYLNGALDASNLRAGLPALKCRINSLNRRGTTTGQVFGETRALSELLRKVQSAGGVAFTDCGTGYCATFVKSIKCTIDTKIGDFGKSGRWTCTFTDGQ